MVDCIEVIVEEYCCEIMKVFWFLFLLGFVMELLVLIVVVLIVVLVGFWLLLGDLMFEVGLFVLLFVLEVFFLIC